MSAVHGKYLTTLMTSLFHGYPSSATIEDADLNSAVPQRRRNRFLLPKTYCIRVASACDILCETMRARSAAGVQPEPRVSGGCTYTSCSPPTGMPRLSTSTGSDGTPAGAALSAVLLTVGLYGAPSAVKRPIHQDTSSAGARRWWAVDCACWGASNRIGRT